MELVDVPIEKGEYCPRTTKICVGCNDYGNLGCKIYNKRISLSSTNQSQLKENLVDSQSDSATNSKERGEVKG